MATKVKAYQPVQQEDPTYPVGSRINDIAVVIDTFSYGPRGRKGKEIYNQFFDALMKAGVGKKVRFDKHVLNSVQRHQLFKQALKVRAKEFGFQVKIGGLRLDKEQYYLEAELIN